MAFLKKIKFENKCKKQLKELPKTNCTEDCPWRVYSKEYNNCFWVLIQKESNTQGEMRQFSQNEIAKLLNENPSKMNNLVKSTNESFANLMRQERVRQVNLEDIIEAPTYDLEGLIESYEEEITDEVDNL